MLRFFIFVRSFDNKTKQKRDKETEMKLKRLFLKPILALMVFSKRCGDFLVLIAHA